jgi:hypothetical protein
MLVRRPIDASQLTLNVAQGEVVAVGGLAANGL